MPELIIEPALVCCRVSEVDPVSAPSLMIPQTLGSIRDQEISDPDGQIAASAASAAKFSPYFSHPSIQRRVQQGAGSNQNFATGLATACLPRCVAGPLSLPTSGMQIRAGLCAALSLLVGGGSG